MRAWIPKRLLALARNREVRLGMAAAAIALWMAADGSPTEILSAVLTQIIVDLLLGRNPSRETRAPAEGS